MPAAKELCTTRHEYLKASGRDGLCYLHKKYLKFSGRVKNYCSRNHSLGTFEMKNESRTEITEHALRKLEVSHTWRDLITNFIVTSHRSDRHKALPN